MDYPFILLMLLLVLTCVVSGHAGKRFALRTGRDPKVWGTIWFFLPIVGYFLALGTIAIQKKVRQHAH
jgi:hypothetical protein